MRWYLDVLKKYAVFQGRARRKEYWMFCLVHLIIVVLFVSISDALSPPYKRYAELLFNCYTVAVLLPAMAVQVRRMHDTGRSGWWAIVPFASTIIVCTDGERGDNRFGPDPKAHERVRFARPLGSVGVRSADGSLTVNSAQSRNIA